VMAAWTGLCIAIAVLDRSRAPFCFKWPPFQRRHQLSLSRRSGQYFRHNHRAGEEMAVAILCVTAVHALFQPWRAIDPIRERADLFWWTRRHGAPMPSPWAPSGPSRSIGANWPPMSPKSA
jgi:hypothetical protein